MDINFWLEIAKGGTISVISLACAYGLMQLMIKKYNEREADLKKQYEESNNDYKAMVNKLFDLHDRTVAAVEKFNLLWEKED